MRQTDGALTAAAERSRWLAELAQAVDQAQWLAKGLRASVEQRAAARQIYESLEAMRIEVELLRRGGWVARGEDNDPQRTNLFPWNRRQTLPPGDSGA